MISSTLCDPYRLGRDRLGARCWAGVLAVSLAIVGTSRAAHAQECFDTPIAVPGLSGLPFWFAIGSATVRTDLDDPRWGGAPVRSLEDDPTGTEVALRTLSDGNILAVSLQVLTDPDGAALNDAVYLGIATSTSGTTAHVIKINPETAGSPDPVPMNAGLSFQIWDRAGGGAWTTSTLVPSWLTTETATWRNSPAGATWAVNLKVDLGLVGVNVAGTSPGADFKIFYEIDVSPSGGLATPFTTPRVTGSPVFVTARVPADPTIWATATALGTPCTTGATVSMFDIGTHDALGPNWIHADAGSTNSFFTYIRSIPPPMFANMIRERIRIADWGSVIGAPDAGWAVIPGADNVPDGTHGTWITPAPGGSSDSADIEFTCSIQSGQDHCPVITSTIAHQCMLVELKAAPGNQVPILTAAAYRNMEFAGLSALDHPATISLRGLQAVTGVGKDRDVYLYVKTLNMPAPGNEPVFLPGKAMADARRYAESPPPRPPKAGDDGQSGSRGKAPPPSRMASDGGEPPLIRSAAEVPVLSAYQKVASVWPTYEVHVYYDTGDTMSVKGRTLKRLAAMIPFGYFVWHDGPLYGFIHSIEGLDGATLLKLAPNFYRVHIVNEGSIRVRTAISAMEKPFGCPPSECCKPPPVTGHPHCYCSTPGANIGGAIGGSAAIAGLIGVWIARSRSRPQAPRR
jgi:hypothetical protein